VRFDLDLSDIDTVDLTFGRRPFASAMLHALSAAGGYPVPMPSKWAEANRRSVRKDGSLVTLLGAFVPDWFSEDMAAPSPSLRTRLGEVRDIVDAPPEDPHLVATFERLTGSRVARSVLDDPTTYVRAVYRSVSRVSSVTAEFWPHAAGLLDRQERRVGLATSREARIGLLTQLVPGTRLEVTS